MTTKLNHRDCANFAPVDVTKGICHLTKDIVLADTEQCADFARLPKCLNCKEFACTPGVSHMGQCNASAHEPKFFAYPEMAAVTCDRYAAL
ncbi:MAG TPA: 4-hydroxyphenylacetate decarboxylase small subunit [Holophaga sp.]|nr:4-hydroxyphenylacetate decarboxylase small subunit [Holophaga sp.]